MFFLWGKGHLERKNNSLQYRYLLIKIAFPILMERKNAQINPVVSPISYSFSSWYPRACAAQSGQNSSNKNYFKMPQVL